MVVRYGPWAGGGEKGKEGVSIRKIDRCGIIEEWDKILGVICGY